MTLSLLTGLLFSSVAVGQSPAAGDWSLGSGTVSAVHLPATLSPDDLDLEYEPGDTVTGVRADLNGDGQPDFILRSAPSLCGATGNCTFAVIDGATLHALGHVGGSRLYVRGRRINGWPVIQSWWHMSAGSGLYSTAVFDGKEYVPLAQVPVEGDGLTQLFSQLDSVPSGPH
jgi:hypothetical protein